MTYKKPVSYSGLKLYKECPRLWHETYILGNRQPSGAAAARGTRLHDLLEQFFKGGAFPSGEKALAPWRDVMVSLLRFAPTAEGEIAVDSEWQRVDYHSPDAYFRGKVDLSYTDAGVMNILDWKSGRKYPEHREQGLTYCALTPGFSDYSATMVYLDDPMTVVAEEYAETDVLIFREQLAQDVEALRSATEYPATPGERCRWCDLSWRKGGDCTRAR